MNITKDTAVTLKYTLTDAKGKPRGSDTTAYLHGGYENLFPKVEAALEGQTVGFSVTVDLSVEEAFGPRDESLVRTIPKAEFPPGVKVGGNMLLGAVGQLQFEVVQHRLKGEYDADIRLEGSQYTGARWITADTPAELREFVNAYPQRMAKDAADTLAFLCTSPYDVRLAQERFPKIHFHPLREHAGLSLGSAG